MRRTWMCACARPPPGARPACALAVGDWPRARRAAGAQCTDELALSPSLIPTRHFQRSLPRLPVPPLGRTLVKCAAAVKPLVPPAQYDKTVAALKDFEMKEGARLQEELVSVDKANQHTSFISSDWFERVLKERDPLPMRRSRTLLVRAPTSRLDMLAHATLWVRSSVMFYKVYLDNTLSPSVRYTPDDARAYYQQDWFERTVALCPEYVSSTFMTAASGGRAVPLDVSQYDNLFNSTRAPGVLQDEVRAVGFMPHIIVQHRGRQFVVTVADADGSPLPEDQIYARLRAVVRLSSASVAGSGGQQPRVDVSAFTALPRTEWNGVRTAMLRHATNQASFEALDSAMFILFLDEDTGADFFADPPGAMRAATARVGECWWDKSLRVHVAASGDVRVGYEESWGDGGAVRRYVEDVYQHRMRRLRGGAAVVDSSLATEPVRELRWSLTPELERAAAAALRSARQDANQLDSGVGVVASVAGRRRSPLGANPAESTAGGPLSGTAPGETACSSPAPSPDGLDTDAVVHLALQLAWWRLNGGRPSVAQPVSMGAFRRGRVDHVYGAAVESHACLLAMAAGSGGGGGAHTADTRELCARALDAHGVVAREVLAGGGVYAHLLGLRNAAVRMYGRTPAVFNDPSVRLLLHPHIVAVPETSPSVLAATSTPVAGGYGVTYTTVEDAAGGDNDSLILHVTSWRGREDSPRCTSGEFVDGVLQAMADIHQLMRG